MTEVLIRSIDRQFPNMPNYWCNSEMCACMGCYQTWNDPNKSELRNLLPNEDSFEEFQKRKEKVRGFFRDWVEQKGFEVFSYRPGTQFVFKAKKGDFMICQDENYIRILKSFKPIFYMEPEVPLSKNDMMDVFKQLKIK